LSISPVLEFPTTIAGRYTRHGIVVCVRAIFSDSNLLR